MAAIAKQTRKLSTANAPLTPSRMPARIDYYGSLAFLHRFVNFGVNNGKAGPTSVFFTVANAQALLLASPHWPEASGAGWLLSWRPGGPQAVFTGCLKMVASPERWGQVQAVARKCGGGEWLSHRAVTAIAKMDMTVIFEHFRWFLNGKFGAVKQVWETYSPYNVVYNASVIDPYYAEDEGGSPVTGGRSSNQIEATGAAR